MKVKEDKVKTEVKHKSSLKTKLSIIGPGIVLAATGIGSGDLITSTTAGAEFGITLAWAAIIGVCLKYILTEGVGRWTLATGYTILEGWRMMGRWATGYFFVYVMLFGLIYGAAIATANGLMMNLMVPSISVSIWAIIHSIIGFLLILLGKYKTFERVIVVLISIMFITVVGSAIMLIPGLANVPAKALIPGIPDGSLFRTLGIVGGIGGTMALAAYGYWIKEKGWHDKFYIPLMRMDVSVAYIMTGIFAVSLMVISAQFLYGSEIEITDTKGLEGFLYLYQTNFGLVPRLILNIGFWSATMSSLLGSWSGIPYLFADFIRVSKKKIQSKTIKRNTSTERKVSYKDPAYRFFLFWLSFPSLILLTVNQPVALILFYAALGSLFLPFLAIT